MSKRMPRKLSQDAIADMTALFYNGWAYRVIAKSFSISEYRVIKTAKQQQLDFKTHGRARYDAQKEDYARANLRRAAYGEGWREAYTTRKKHAEMGLYAKYDPTKKKSEEFLELLEEEGSPTEDEEND